jgi:hypothetical protein
MMARILAHQRDLGNGVGLHYSGFHRFSAVPAPSNQLLASIPPRKNRYYCQPIREDGLAADLVKRVVDQRQPLARVPTPTGADQPTLAPIPTFGDLLGPLTLKRHRNSAGSGLDAR